MASENCLIEKMLNNLSASRHCMGRQIAAMTEVLDKSNNTVLQLEASRSIKPPIKEPNTVPFTFKKETVNSLSKIMDQSFHMLSTTSSAGVSSPDSVVGICLEDYMEMSGQRTEYLAGNVRKVLAVWDVVQQMRLMLLRQEMELEGSDDEFE